MRILAPSVFAPSRTTMRNPEGAISAAKMAAASPAAPPPTIARSAVSVCISKYIPDATVHGILASRSTSRAGIIAGGCCADCPPIDFSQASIMPPRWGCGAASRTLRECGEDLADGAEVIGGVGGAGECAAGADVIPGGAGGDGGLPFFDLLAQGRAKFFPLIVGDGGALPTGVPVCAGEGIFLTGGPAIHKRKAEMQVIDVRGDGGLAGHGASGGGDG